MNNVAMIGRVKKIGETKSGMGQNGAWRNASFQLSVKRSGINFHDTFWITLWNKDCDKLAKCVADSKKGTKVLIEGFLENKKDQNDNYKIGIKVNNFEIVDSNANEEQVLSNGKTLDSAVDELFDEYNVIDNNEKELLGDDVLWD